MSLEVHVGLSMKMNAILPDLKRVKHKQKSPCFWRTFGAQ